MSVGFAIARLLELWDLLEKKTHTVNYGVLYKPLKALTQKTAPFSFLHKMGCNAFQALIRAICQSVDHLLI